jgi:hypothetical protein
MMTEGFLNRWSRRKAGKHNETEEQLEEVVTPPAQNNLEIKAPVAEESPPVTLEDVEKIDRLAPDFSAFMKPGVDPEVQRAALKKMFTDPHFNVMDGLDIYIDDYSKPDPLPPGMLERMVQSDMLKLFQKTDETDEKADRAGEQDARAAAISQSDRDTVGASEQSELVSNQSEAQQKIANLDELHELPIEPVQKKNQEGSA